MVEKVLATSINQYLIVHEYNFPQCALLIYIDRMSQTIRVTDLLQGLMTHIGIEICAEDVMSVMLKK